MSVSLLLVALVFIFFGIGGIALQIILSMQKNKIWGLIIPVIDLVAIIAIIVLGVLMVNVGSILVLYMVIFSSLFLGHCFIYIITRLILKSKREKEERALLDQEKANITEQKNSLKDEIKKMEIDDL